MKRIEVFWRETWQNEYCGAPSDMVVCKTWEWGKKLRVLENLGNFGEYFPRFSPSEFFILYHAQNRKLGDENLGDFPWGIFIKLWGTLIKLQGFPIPSFPVGTEFFSIVCLMQLRLATFKFNTNQHWTVSAFVMISVIWSNQRAHQVISEKLLSKEFHFMTTDHK